MFEDLIQDWDGEEVVVRFDAPADAWMFVCVHSTVRGPSSGGTRMKVYPTPTDALRDGLRLSEAMTRKNAVAGLPMGGGKGILAVSEVPRGEARRGLLLRYGDLVASLGGTYVTACDMNTTAEDMDVVAERCPYTLGRTVEAGGSGGSGPSTAVGVFHGIRASVAHAFGSEDLGGRSVLVQGLGAVGGTLVQLLAEAGAGLLVSDVDPDRAGAAADRFGAKVVDPDQVVGTECDVFSPCATGRILSAQTIPRLRCRVVAGAANNQLVTGEYGERLGQAGIVYAPDYVVNAGGIIRLVGLERLGWSEQQLDERLAGIGDTLTEVYAIAEAEGISTEAASGRIVERRLAEAQSEA